MFRQIFGSKLQHQDPEVRRSAIAELEADDPRLGEVALADDDDAVRQAAIEKLTAVDTLSTIAQTDATPAARAAASQRLCAVLCTPFESEDEWQRRSACIAGLRTDQNVIERVAREASDQRVRSAALTHVESEVTLARVAANDPAGQLRTAALERVQQESLLEEISRSARSRDKGIARLAKERADTLRRQRERAEAADRLCLEIERLAASDLDAVDTVAYQKLDQEWERWAEDDQDFPELRDRYATARGLIQQRLTGRAEAKRRGDELLAKLATASEAPSAAEQLDVDAIRAEWGALDIPSEPTGAASAFEEAVDRLERSKARWRRDQALTQELEARLDAWEQRLAQAVESKSAVVSGAEASGDEATATSAGADTPGGLPAEAVDVSAVATEWAALEKPSSPEALQGLTARFDALMRELTGAAAATTETSASQQSDADAPPPTPDPARLAERIDALTSKLDQADKHIGAGDLKPAAAAFDAARAISEQLGNAKNDNALTKARERLAATGPKLNELRSWRRWSTDRARERLCDEVEQLLNSEQEATALARTIRDYRESWKKLDKAEGGASKALWERFNNACTKAYEPCAKHFAAEAEQRNDNLKRKLSLVEKMESLASSTDWEGEVDWRALDKAMGNFRREWRNVGPVNRRDNKALMERHDGVRKMLDERLGPVRERELDRRRRTVEQLTDIAEGDDLRGAADRAKRAQADWTPLVRAPRKVEQALWTDFRAACDRIFERLREQREHAQGARDGALKQAQAACERIESLTAELTSLAFASEDQAREKALVDAVKEARTAYSSAGEVPRAKEGGLKARYRKAVDAFDGARRERQRSRQQAGLVALAERAAIADRLEQATLRSTGDDLSTVIAEGQSAWAASAAVQDKALAAITARYERALAAAQGDEAATDLLRSSLVANLREREQLCLELEIATGVDSPAALKQRRMALQIDRLQASMSGTEQAAGAQIEKMLRRWFELGPVDRGAHEELDARFAQVQAAALGARFRR